MKIKKLRNKNSKKYFLCGLILVVVLTITVTFIGSKANYRMTASIPLTEGKVVSSPYDINIVAMYIDGVEQDRNTLIPNGYRINEEESYCYKGTNKENKEENVKLYTDELGNHVFSGISKSSKCILYFNKAEASKPATMQELLDNYYIYKKVRTSKNKDFNVPFVKETKNTVYVAPDGDNYSYYFAGNPLDNWVEFGGYYWRIIRVNGDGTIRMIYQGRTEDEIGNKLEPQVNGEETQIGASAFNNSRVDIAYIGYFYEQGIVHGLKEASIIYTHLNNWFKNSNIKQGSIYFDSIDKDAGFCGDREPSSNRTIIDGKGGIENTSATWYGANVRLIPNGEHITIDSLKVMPSINCKNNDDLYTYIGAKEGQGNHKLENPTGLITADEASYAGITYDTASSGNYLDTDMGYWTNSPADYSPNYARLFRLRPDGATGVSYASTPYGIRPVINLRADVTFTGDGTITNPFKVVIF